MCGTIFLIAVVAWPLLMIVAGVVELFVSKDPELLFSGLRIVAIEVCVLLVVGWLLRSAITVAPF